MTGMMASRFLSSGVFALVTTIALFLTMKVLVTGRDYEIEKELDTVGIDFVRVERDEDVNTKDRALKRPSQQQPDEPPPPPKLQQTQRPNMDKATMSADFGLDRNRRSWSPYPYWGAVFVAISAAAAVHQVVAGSAVSARGLSY